MRWLTVVLIGLLAGQSFAADELNPATALLRLAKAQREREAIASRPHPENPCLTDLGQAQALAKLRNVPLFVWVAEDCHKGLRARFPKAVHVHVKDWQGDAEPQLILPTPGGGGWSWGRKGLSVETEAEIRKAIAGEDPRPVPQPKAPPEVVPSPVQFQSYIGGQVVSRIC